MISHYHDKPIGGTGTTLTRMSPTLRKIRLTVLKRVQFDFVDKQGVVKAPVNSLALLRLGQTMMKNVKDVLESLGMDGNEMSDLDVEEWLRIYFDIDEERIGNEAKTEVEV